MLPNIIIGRKGEHVRVDESYARKMVDDYLPRIRAYSGEQSLEPKDVIVRGTLIINSARDYYYSRFSDSAMQEVAEMLPGRPVMANHTYGLGSLGLPLGRFFAANIVRRTLESWPERDSKWVEALFFMPNDEEGQRVARRIDMGVYKESSLAWRCAGVDCSVCNEDVRTCGHIPGEVYERGGLAEFSFSGVTGVMEGSLVFSGGQKDTVNFKPSDDGERSSAEFEGIAWNRMTEWKRAKLGIAEGDEPIETLLRGSSHDAPIRRNLFAVECGVKRFSEEQAARWVRDHGFRADKRERGSDGFRFNQSDVRAGAVKHIQLDEHVHGLMLKERDSKRSESDDTLEGVNLA